LNLKTETDGLAMKKIISFSLYNNVPSFQVGAVVNVLEAKRLYPDWRCRFYTTDDEGICSQLEYLGAEVVRMDDWPDGHMFWRFLAADDADICLSRDCDSVVSEREVGAVNEWLESDYQWHGMHDHRYHHKTSIMGGMWGCKHYGDKIPEARAQEGAYSFDFHNDKSMRNHIEEWLAASEDRITVGRNWDQQFLGYLYENKAQTNIMWHGSWANSSGNPYPKHVPCRYSPFVGSYSFHASKWSGDVYGDKDVTDGYFKRKEDGVSKGMCIYHNLGLGDHILMNGAVRHILKKEKLDHIRLVCKEHNAENVIHMYRDEPRIEVCTINNQPNATAEIKAANWINWYVSHINNESIAFPMLNLVYSGGEGFEKIFYEKSGIAIEERYNSFYFERDAERELRLLEKVNPPDNYALICLNSSRSSIEKTDLKTSLPIVEFENIEDDLIFDWIPIIKNAKEIHSVNTSFFHLVNSINPSCKKVYYPGISPEVDYEGWSYAD